MSIQDDLEKAKRDVAKMEAILAAYPDAAADLDGGFLVATVPIGRCNGVKLIRSQGDVLAAFGDESMLVWSKAPPVRVDDLLVGILEQPGGPEMIQRALDEIAAFQAKNQA